MHSYLRWFLILLVVVGVSTVVLLVVGFPRLVEVSPKQGAMNVAANEPLQITFSRRMDPETVVERLALQPPLEGQATWDENTLIYTPDGGWPTGAVITVTLQSGAEAANFPSLPLREGKTWSFAAEQPRLAFLYPSQGPANVYVYEPLIGENVPLTNVFAGVTDFEVLASGEQPALIYSTPVTGGSEINTMTIAPRLLAPPSGETATPQVPTQPQRVVDCPGANCRTLAVSPTGRYLAYERTALPGGEGPAVPQVWFVPLDPSTGQAAGEPRLAGGEGRQTLQPVWAADDRLAYYDTDEKAFYLLRPEGGDRLRLPNSTGQAGDWRPDAGAFLASEIIFLDPAGSTDLGLERLADSHLLLYDARSGATQDLTAEEGIEDATPAYSPDGTKLAFARKFLDAPRWTPGRQLWLMDLGDQSARQLTADPVYNHFDFEWSPASDRVAFVRFNQSALNEPPEVWMVDLLSGEFSRIMIGGYAPQWIP